LALSPFLQQSLAQETQMTNATDLMTNQTSGSNSLLASVLNISRTAGDNAVSTAAEYVLNATPGNNSMNMTNVTIVNNNNETGQ
jgi:copper(I)-binding protein